MRNNSSKTRRGVKTGFALTGAAGLMLAAAAMTAPAYAQDTTTYQARLDPLNNSGGSGSLTLELSGDTATITEHFSGLAATFKDMPYPHVQHIHGGAEGVCPTTANDTNGDGVISTPEGQKTYGPIQTTLSVTGDTSPKATNIKIAPSGAGADYSRTIRLDAATLKSLRSGIGVIVVHGLDPTTPPSRRRRRRARWCLTAAGRHRTRPVRAAEGDARLRRFTGTGSTAGYGDGVHTSWLLGPARA